MDNNEKDMKHYYWATAATIIGIMFCLAACTAVVYTAN